MNGHLTGIRCLNDSKKGKKEESDGSSEISSDRQRRVSCAADELYLDNHPPGLDMDQLNIRTWTYCKDADDSGAAANSTQQKM